MGTPPRKKNLTILNNGDTPSKKKSNKLKFIQL
jgi:hypothetical protein